MLPGTGKLPGKIEKTSAGPEPRGREVIAYSAIIKRSYQPWASKIICSHSLMDSAYTVYSQFMVLS